MPSSPLIVIFLIGYLIFLLLPSSYAILNLFKPLEGCHILGFPNATINSCGYCVGGGTGLPPLFGTDCKGVCDGGSKLDCNGVCDGDMSIDECTGVCPNKLNATAIESNEIKGTTTTTSNPPFFERDCKGSCMDGSTLFTYSKDKCGVCRLSGDPSPSPFVDCHGKCINPGSDPDVEICGKCISPSHRRLVEDPCGNCLSKGNFCSCDKDPASCGCRDAASCYSVKHIFPHIAPKRVVKNIHLSGYFKPSSRDVLCVFRHHTTGQLMTSPSQFMSSNFTDIQCLNVSFPREGVWTVSLRSDRTVKDILVDSRIKVIVYDGGNVSPFSAISPTSISSEDSHLPLTIKFLPIGSRIPSVPMSCLLVHNETGVRIDGEEGVEPLSCNIQFPGGTLRHRDSGDNVGVWSVTPTLGNDTFPSLWFSLKVATPSPQVVERSSFISTDGLTIVIMFSDGVFLKTFTPLANTATLCGLLISSHNLQSLDHSYDVKSCAFVSGIQLVIYLQKPITSESIEIYLKEGILVGGHGPYYESNREEVVVTVKKVTSEWGPSPLMLPSTLIITGPSEIPSCGVFSLSGLLSSPRGSFGIKFTWAIKMEGDSSSKGNVLSPDLQLLVDLTQSEHLILDSSLFTPGIRYSFTLTAKIDRTEQLSSTHLVIKHAYPAPIVSIYSNTMMPLFPMRQNHRILLFSEAYVPSCVFPVQRVILSWRPTSPRVRMPFNMAYSPILSLPPFSLPASNKVSFILSSFIGSFADQNSGAAFSLLLQPPHMTSSINGGVHSITIGVDSGLTFSITSDGSGTEGRTNSWFQPIWSCLSVSSHNPCYNHDHLQTPLRGSNDRLLIQDRTNRTLTLKTSSFPPNEDLVFSLKVLDAESSSDTELVIVKTVQGPSPIVSVGPIIINKENIASIRSPQNLAFVVPSGSLVSVKGSILYRAESNVTIHWSSPHFPHPLTWTEERVGTQVINTEVFMLSNSIFPYGVHVVELEACVNSFCSKAATQFTVSSGVTGCEVKAGETYQEWEMTMVTIEGCNIPAGVSPVSFQMFLHDRPLSVPQFSRVFFFPGPSPSSFPDKSGSPSMIFTVKICDIFQSCNTIQSTPVTVRPASNRTLKTAVMLDLAKRYNQAGGMPLALSVLSNLLQSQQESQVASDTAVSYVVSSLQSPSFFLNSGQATLILSTLTMALNQSRIPDKQDRILSSAEKLLKKGMAFQALPDLDAIHSFIHAMGKQNITSESGRAAFSAIIQSLVATVPLGGKVELGGKADLEGKSSLYTVILHEQNLQDVILTTPSSNGQEMEGQVSFGPKIRNQFTPGWACDANNGDTKCHSVIFAVTLFPNGGPFVLHSKAHYLTPTLQVAIYSPKTFQQMDASGFVSVHLSLMNGSFPKAEGDWTRCHKWSDDSRSWTHEAHYLASPEKGRVSCWSNSLGSFSVLIGSTTELSTIFGIGLGIILVMMIAVSLLFCCAQRSCRSTPSMLTTLSDATQSSHTNSVSTHRSTTLDDRF